MGSIPGWEVRSHVLCGAAKKFKKIQVPGFFEKLTEQSSLGQFPGRSVLLVLKPLGASSSQAPTSSFREGLLLISTYAWVAHLKSVHPSFYQKHDLAPGCGIFLQPALPGSNVPSAGGSKF